MIGEMREQPVSLFSHWPVPVTSENLRQLEHPLKHNRSSKKVGEERKGSIMIRQLMWRSIWQKSGEIGKSQRDATLTFLTTLNPLCVRHTKGLTHILYQLCNFYASRCRFFRSPGEVSSGSVLRS